MACLWKKKLFESFGKIDLMQDAASSFSFGQQQQFLRLFFRSLDFFCYFFYQEKRKRQHIHGEILQHWSLFFL
jgi:hypothetical protein